MITSTGEEKSRLCTAVTTNCSPGVTGYLEQVAITRLHLYYVSFTEQLYRPPLLPLVPHNFGEAQDKACSQRHSAT